MSKILVNHLVRFALIATIMVIITSCGTFEVGTEPIQDSSPENEINSKPTAAPTIAIEPVEEAPEMVWSVLETALSFILLSHGEQAHPPPGMDWQVENVTPQDRVGLTTYLFSAKDLVVTISFPIVAPDATVFQISVENRADGFQWDGEVDAQGNVSELSVSVGTAVDPEEMIIPPDIISLDDVWNLYTNNEVGFSIQLPKMMMAMNGACVWNEERGSYQWEMARVPASVFEDSDVIYIAGETFYLLEGRREEATGDGGIRVFFDECSEMANSLDFLRDPESYYQQMWKLDIEDELSKADLESFLKSRYGAGCSLGEISASDQEGVFDVSILGDGKSLEETLCPLNFGTVVKYYPVGNTVIAWDTGQAYTFPADEINSVTYDQEMVDSFRYIVDAALDDPSNHMPAGASEEISNWWGVIHSTEFGAQFDDYFERQDLGQIIFFGIESQDPSVNEQIEALRDSGVVVHLYGTLLSNVLDYNGSQILVNRIETEMSEADLSEDWETYIDSDFGFSFEYPAEWELVVIPRQPIDEGPGSPQWLADAVVLTKENLAISIQHLRMSEQVAWDGSRMGGPYQEAITGEPLTLIGQEINKLVWKYNDGIKAIEVQAVNPDADLVLTITLRDNSVLLIEDPGAETLPESVIADLDGILRSFKLMS